MAKPVLPGTLFDMLASVEQRVRVLENTVGDPSTSLYFNVRDPYYGAAGDNDSDDRESIQAAIDDAQIAGGVVFLPLGIYRIGSPGLLVGRDVSIQGSKGSGSSQTAGSVWTQASGYTGDILTLSTSGLIVDDGFPSYLRFQDFQIYNASSSSGNAVICDEVLSETTFRDMVFTNASSSGHSIRLGSSPAACERIFWDKCVFIGGSINNYHVMSTGAQFDKCLFHMCSWLSFHSYAVYLDVGDVRTFTMSNCVVHGQDNSSNQCRGTLYLDASGSAQGINIIGAYSENTGDRGTTAEVVSQGDIVLRGTAPMFANLIGCELQAPGGAASYLNIQSPSGKVILANAFGNSGALTDPNTLAVTL